jgi:hypothetical protein
MTTEDIIIQIFYEVDSSLPPLFKEAHEKLYPSEVITIGILFALKGGYFRAFYRWLKRDWDGLFGGLPERTALQRQLRDQPVHTDKLLAQPSVLNVVDSYPIELIFPIREGRSAQQIGRKGRDKGRWSIGVKLGWALNVVGQGCTWGWTTLNRPDQDFLDWLGEFEEQAVMMADWGFRCADGVPNNIKLCKKGTYNDRMVIETSFSLLTVVAHAKQMHHRLEDYMEARLAYTVALFNICLRLFHRLHPDEPAFKMSIAEFSL